jgi:hypothetical protein
MYGVLTLHDKKKLVGTGRNFRSQLYFSAGDI